jgi:hypothetical protein
MDYACQTTQSNLFPIKKHYLTRKKKINGLKETERVL